MGWGFQHLLALDVIDLIAYLTGEGNGNPLQYSCLGNPRDRGAWWAAVHGVARSRTRLNDFTFTFHFHALEKEMATHSSVLAWRIPGTGQPGGLPSMGSHRVGHNWSDLTAAAAAAAYLTSMYWGNFDQLKDLSSSYFEGKKFEEPLGMSLPTQRNKSQVGDCKRTGR